MERAHAALLATNAIFANHFAHYLDQASTYPMRSSAAFYLIHHARFPLTLARLCRSAQPGRTRWECLKEFRDFAVKGNVIDLAVGIIIGAAFGKIVDSLVNDVVMPAINAMAGGAVDFSNQYLVLSGSVAPGTPLAAARTSAVVLAWGNFLTILLNFIILAFVIFWMIKAANRVRSGLDATAPRGARGCRAPARDSRRTEAALRPLSEVRRRYADQRPTRARPPGE